MAVNGNEIHRLNQQRVRNGHNIYCLISVQALRARQTWPYTINFNTKCRCFPTSWTLAITYQQNQETGVFSCSVTLKRNDSLNILVNAHVLISFLNINGRTVRFQRTVFNDSISSGQERQGSFTDAKLPTCLIFSDGGDIDLQITTFFRFCLSQTNFESNTLKKLKNKEEEDSDEEDPDKADSYEKDSDEDNVM
ncbi:hypothetical protein HNY73_010502 [Argiope bruennichi]|uniref:Uncharacterized protein n=1 Tax=Argiope bruennichi TaxID=94029 RepID=A0A8T0F652_ARGBR|nr:hypothetical protein HNY73_010502 [Argiope bruennichi]